MCQIHRIRSSKIRRKTIFVCQPIRIWNTGICIMHSLCCWTLHQIFNLVLMVGAYKIENIYFLVFLSIKKYGFNMLTLSSLLQCLEKLFFNVWDAFCHFLTKISSTTFRIWLHQQFQFYRHLCIRKSSIRFAFLYCHLQ